MDQDLGQQRDLRRASRLKQLPVSTHHKQEVASSQKQQRPGEGPGEVFIREPARWILFLQAQPRYHR